MTMKSPYIDKGLNRRAALKFATLGAAAGTPFATNLGLMGTAAAQNARDYKALVCVFLYGGNDQSNLLMPRSGSAYQAYYNARPSLAHTQGEMLAINPAGFTGPPLGLSPHMPRLKALFDQGRMAMMANVGTLAYPVTKAQFEANSRPLPFQLFSHSDQSGQWQTGVPDQASRTGWLGRIGDLISSGYNDPGAISMAISLNGNNTIQIGNTTLQYQLTTDGPVTSWGLRGGFGFWDGNARAALQTLLTQQRSHLFENGLNLINDRAIKAEALVNDALEKITPLTTAFPDNSLGDQAKMAARMMRANAQLGQRRQIFFLASGGWDFHDDLRTDQAANLAELDGALSALYAATVEMGLASNVTTFTASDFGRALQHNGRGSDHGWGGHHMILGGAVKGNRIYGTFPTVALDSADDGGQGRLIPTTSVDQYAATLARWFGVSPSDLSLVMPNLSRFSSQDLGFMT
jgi:uncharacterized protein (DUF1501 family)